MDFDCSSLKDKLYALKWHETKWITAHYICIVPRPPLMCLNDILGIEINSFNTINGLSCVSAPLYDQVGCVHNATGSHKFPAEGECERWRELSLYLRMINPTTTSPTAKEWITVEPWADLLSSENRESEEAVLWLETTAILHLCDVLLNPRTEPQWVQFLLFFL